MKITTIRINGYSLERTWADWLLFEDHPQGSEGGYIRSFGSELDMLSFLLMCSVSAFRHYCRLMLEPSLRKGLLFLEEMSGRGVIDHSVASRLVRMGFRYHHHESYKSGPMRREIEVYRLQGVNYYEIRISESTLGGRTLQGMSFGKVGAPTFNTARRLSKIEQTIRYWEALASGKPVEEAALELRK